MASNFSLFKKFVSQLLIGLNTLTQKGIVHCDLKPENILIKYDPIERDTKEVKIIDFGASFLFNGTPFLTVTTPEYLPPEFLQLFAGKKAMNNKQKHDILLKKSLPWSIDVWSLGIIIIEIMLGVPVWMSFKCRTTLNNKETIMMGLFSSTSRDNEKIADKMVKFVPVMRKKMRDLIGFYPQFDAVLDLLEKMLALDPLKRPAPKELLGHPFFVL